LDTKEATHQYRLNKWIDIIKECRSSGQTVSVWCEDHNVSTKSYYYWLRQVRAAACDALPTIKPKENTIVPVSIHALSSTKANPDQRISGDITLLFGSVTLELHNTASAVLIESTLRALQNVR
jgi:transposase-like protein